MAKEQLKYRLSVPYSKRNKTHIVHEPSCLSVCGTNPGYGVGGSFKAPGRPRTLAAIDKLFMRAPNPCARCEIFAFRNI